MGSGLTAHYLQLGIEFDFVRCSDRSFGPDCHRTRQGDGTDLVALGADVRILSKKSSRGLNYFSKVPIPIRSMKKLLTLGVTILLAATFDACKKSPGPYAGVEGDYVSGTPLPDRIEGANFSAAM